MIKKLWQDIWTVLNTEIPIPWAEAIAGGVESTQAVLDLAQALDDNRTIQETDATHQSSVFHAECVECPGVSGLLGQPLSFYSDRYWPADVYCRADQTRVVSLDIHTWTGNCASELQNTRTSPLYFELDPKNWTGV